MIDRRCGFRITLLKNQTTARTVNDGIFHAQPLFSQTKLPKRYLMPIWTKPKRLLMGSSAITSTRRTMNWRPSWGFTISRKNGRLIDLSSLILSSSTSSTSTTPHRRRRRRLCIFVHGLTDNESVWASTKHCESYGELLLLERQQVNETEDDGPWTCAYLRYNTGLHVSTNGQRLCQLLDVQLARLLVGGSSCGGEDIVDITFICHSMGGLVTRSACLRAVKNLEAAVASTTESATDPNRSAVRSSSSASSSCSSSSWIQHVRRIIFLGTPHHGSYWEQLGNVVSTSAKQIPYFGRTVAEVANVRSAGIKDLRYGYLQDEDWHGRDPDAFLTNDKTIAALLPHVDYYIASGTVTIDPHHPLAYLVGDALVSRDSAQGRSKQQMAHMLGIPDTNIREFPGVGHLRLPNHRDVYEQIKEWIDRPCRHSGSIVQLHVPHQLRSTTLSSSDRHDDVRTIGHQASGRKWAQAKGVTTLLETAVDKGATAVEEVQDRIAKHVYDVVAVVVPGARIVESIHGTISKGIFASIRYVNYGVGAIYDARRRRQEYQIRIAKLLLRIRSLSRC